MGIPALPRLEQERVKSPSSILQTAATVNEGDDNGSSNERFASYDDGGCLL